MHACLRTALQEPAPGPRAVLDAQTKPLGASSKPGQSRADGAASDPLRLHKVARVEEVFNVLL